MFPVKVSAKLKNNTKDKRTIKTKVTLFSIQYHTLFSYINFFVFSFFFRERFFLRKVLTFSFFILCYALASNTIIAISFSIFSANRIINLDAQCSLCIFIYFAIYIIINNRARIKFTVITNISANRTAARTHFCFLSTNLCSNIYITRNNKK